MPCLHVSYCSYINLNAIINHRLAMLVDQLKNALGERCILTGPAETQAFTEDWRGRYRGSALCVALPATTDEVSTIVQLCAAAGVSIIAQGGNTSLCGGAVPNSNAPPPVIVNLQRMRRVRSIDRKSVV